MLFTPLFLTPVFVKISEKRRIDGMVSLLNAWVIYVRDYEDYMYLVG